MAPKDGIADALRRLDEALRAEIERHPQLPAHLLRREPLQVALNLELGKRAVDPETRASELRQALRRELDGLIAHHQSFRPGHVLNLRTGLAEGKDTTPPDSRFVFGGYSPSGYPRFLDFGQWLLQLEHPDQHLLYRKPPGLVTVVTPGHELTTDLLQVYDDAPADQRIHGQVTAGWYPIRRTDGTSATLAITLQVVSSTATQGSKGRSPRRRIGLNLLLAGPDGESVDEVYARMDPIPWASTVEWARQALTSVEASQSSRPSKAGGDDDGIEKRIQGILRGAARRLAQKQRGHERRTGHAEQRHRSGKRPTSMAMKDLARAQDHDILVDPRKDTLIVLGDRGRAHVFNRAGKLVTSIHYPPDAIDRKRKAEIWTPAGSAEIRTLRQEAERQGTAD